MRGRSNENTFISDTGNRKDIRIDNGHTINLNPGNDDKLNKTGDIIDDTISIVDKISFTLQQVAANAKRSAGCAIRSAIITKNGIDNSKKAMKCMRKTAFAVTDISDSVELLVARINELHKVISPINDITSRINLTAENALNNAAHNQKGIDYTDALRDILQLAGKLDNKTNHVSGIINKLISDARRCTESIKTGSRLVDEGCQIANQTSMLMENVMDTIEDTSGQIDMILTSSENAALFGDDTIEMVNNTPEISKPV